MVAAGAAACLVLFAVSSGAATRCLSNSDCDDGVFCNGAERCVGNDRARAEVLIHPAKRARPGICRTAARAACVQPGAVPMLCDELPRRCIAIVDCGTERDKDGDGHDDTACGGDDCDDLDSQRFPGHAELCDPADRDEDCDPTTFGVRDSDGDGDPDATCCNVAGGERVCGTDCDDLTPGVHQGLAEVCDGRDNDCDGATDEGVRQVFYPDADGDGFGAVGSPPVSACQGGPGLSPLASDCDDTATAIHPGAMSCTGPASVRICQSDGSFTTTSCVQGFCLSQPNGTGICR